MADIGIVITGDAQGVVAATQTATKSIADYEAAVSRMAARLTEMSAAERQAFDFVERGGSIYEAATLKLNDMTAAQGLATQAAMAAAGTYQELDSVVERTQTRQAIAFNAVSRGFSVLESSAHASVRSIDAISNAVGGLAFGFGPEGFLVGAVVMAGIAIERALLKADEAVKKIDADFAHFVATTKDLPVALGGTKVLAGDVKGLEAQLVVAQKELNEQLAVGVDADASRVLELQEQLRLAKEYTAAGQQQIGQIAPRKYGEEGIKIMLEGQHAAAAEILRLAQQTESDRAAGLTGTAAREQTMLDAKLASYDAVASLAKGMTVTLGAQLIDAQRILVTDLDRLRAAQALAAARRDESDALKQIRAQQEAIAKWAEQMVKEQEKADREWAKRQAEAAKNANIGLGFTSASLDREIAQEVRKVGEELDRTAAKAAALTARFKEMNDMGTIGTEAIAEAFTALGEALSSGHFDGKKMLAQFGTMLSRQMQALATADLAMAVSASAGVVTGVEAGPMYAAAAKAEAASIAIAALTGALGGGASASSGGGAYAANQANQRSLMSMASGSQGDATIVIQGGILNMNDPEQEQALARAIASLSGRRVTIRKGMP